MKSRIVSIALAIALTGALYPAVSYANQTDSDLIATTSDQICVQSTAIARPMNLRPKYSAYFTNGKKGAAYKTYTSYPFDGTVIYKARIVGSKLRLSGKYQATGGTIAKPGKRYKVKNKAFKLTSKTKYYQHTGNNNFYIKSSKAKIKKLLKHKPKGYAGDISFTVKNGKVTLLCVQ